MKIILNNCVLAFFFLLTSIANAASPEDMTAQFYQYINANQWNNIADLLDESALSDFKKQMLPLLSTEAKNGRNGLLRKTFGKEATFDDAKNASTKVFFVNVISNVAGLVRNSGIKTTQTTIIGKVSEGEDVMHVLVRENYKLGEMELTNMEVLSFMKAGNDWSMLLSGKIRGLVQTLQTSTYQLRNRKK
ncbi:hypothetical protein [Kaarinaea lacus]